MKRKHKYAFRGIPMTLSRARRLQAMEEVLKLCNSKRWSFRRTAEFTGFKEATVRSMVRDLKIRWKKRVLKRKTPFCAKVSKVPRWKMLLAARLIEKGVKFKDLHKKLCVSKGTIQYVREKLGASHPRERRPKWVLQQVADNPDFID